MFIFRRSKLSYYNYKRFDEARVQKKHEWIAALLICFVNFY